MESIYISTKIPECYHYDPIQFIQPTMMPDNMFLNTLKKIIHLFLAITLIAMLTACGQKGDLYHPEGSQASLADKNTNV